MQPVILRGRSQLAFGPQEFAERVAALQQELAVLGLDAAVAFGDARNYAPLTWVTGLVPMLKWAVAVTPAVGETELYLAMPGVRDLPRMNKLAVAGSIAPIGALSAALARFDRVALAGGHAMRAASESMIRQATATVDGDSLFAKLMEAPSEREREVLRLAATTADASATTTLDAWARGEAASEALLCGDLSARRAGMHDVRILFSLDGGLTLRPLAPGATERRRPLVFYIAVETGGYWGEALRSTGGGQVPQPLAPMARLGLSVDELGTGRVTPGVYSHRELDDTGTPSSRIEEVH